MRLHLFLLSALLLWPSLSAASLPELKQLAIENELHSKQEWFDLLHYRQNSGVWVSESDDPNFFNHEQGKFDAEAELIATLASFFEAPSDAENNDRHPQCLFPARFSWLATELPNLTTLAPKVKCKAFENWYSEMDPHQATLIFPAAYINSPSSMFGHTLVRIDGKAQNQETRLLAYSISYAAKMPENVNGFDFVWGGIFGGYPGYLYGGPYYEKVVEYNDLEARDVWEFPLKLSANELDHMIRHIWELQRVRFDYFFFDENCSYRLNRILDVAKPGLNSSQVFTTHAIPADTVRVLEDTGILGTPVYRPSTLTQLRHRNKSLSSNEIDLVRKLVSDAFPLQETLSQNFSEQRLGTVLEFAYDYLQYKLTKSQVDADFAKKRSLKLLSKRSKLAEIPTFTPDKPLRPDHGHGTTRYAFYVGKSDENFLGLRFRPAFHDLLDNDQGYVSGAQIDFLSLDLRYLASSEELRLERFALLDIIAQSPYNRLFKPISWRVDLGWKRIDEKPAEKTRFNLEGGGGIAPELSDSLQLGFFGLGNLRAKADFSSNFESGIGLESSALWKLPFNSKLQLFHQKWFYEGKNESDGREFGVKFNLPLINIDNAMRIEISREELRVRKENKAVVAWNHYF